MSWQIVEADCVDAMRSMDEASVDAVVTDPPYDLTGGGEQHCASDVLRNAIVRDSQYGDLLSGKRAVSLRVSVQPVGVHLGRVALDHEAAAGNVEVHGDTASRQVEDVLVDSLDAAAGEQVSGGEFRLGVREGLSRCVGSCRCAAQSGSTTLRIPVGLRYDPAGNAERPSRVVALARAELTAVLSFDMRRGTVELSPAEGAEKVDPRFLLFPTESVRAGATARRLAAMLQANDVGEVDGAANFALSFDLLAHRDLLAEFRPSLARGGFMNAAWDGTGIAFDPRTWREALRVLKPGGFLLAFGGCRTYHRLACAVEDAGFEIRDRVLALGSDGKGGDAVRELGAELDWLYSSGFP